MKIICQFTKLFSQIPKKNSLLSFPLQSRNQARKIPYYYESPLPINEIENLLKSLQFFSPNEAIQIMKKSIKLKQVFGKDEFTQFFLNSNLDSVHMANIILLCYKLNLSEELWVKCLCMNVEHLTPYYLSETMWALKNKTFTNPEDQKRSIELQESIVKQIPNILDKFDFYCLSLMMQSLANHHPVNWNALASHFVNVAQSSDHFSLSYGLYALAKQSLNHKIELNNQKIVDMVQNEITTLKQSDLLIILWSIQKLQVGTEEFWTYAFKFLQAQRLQNLQSIAMQSQILSQLYRVEEYQWVYMEKVTLEKLKSDEKSVVTLFQTFSLNKKGSENFWQKLTNQILQDIKTYKLESLFNLASHSEIKEFSEQIPLDWKLLNISQRCLIFNKFAKIGVNVTNKYKFILDQIEFVKGRDIILVLYTIYKYAQHLDKQPVLNQLQNTISDLNQLDIEQLLELKDLPLGLYEKIISTHGNHLNQKSKDMWSQLQVQQ